MTKEIFSGQGKHSYPVSTLVMSAVAFVPPLVFHCFDPGFESDTLSWSSFVPIYMCGWGVGALLWITLTYSPLIFFLLLNTEEPAVRVRLSLTRVSVACSQEWLWPTWTPAWQDTRRQPPWTLVRGSTCWTWSPLARRSRRLPTHGNNWKRAFAGPS